MFRKLAKIVIPGTVTLNLPVARRYNQQLLDVIFIAELFTNQQLIQVLQPHGKAFFKAHFRYFFKVFNRLVFNFNERGKCGKRGKKFYI